MSRTCVRALVQSTRPQLGPVPGRTLPRRSAHAAFSTAKAGGPKLSDADIEKLISGKSPPSAKPPPAPPMSEEEVARIQANQEVFRQLSWRGARALSLLMVSVVFLVFVTKYKAKQKRDEREKEMTPSERYLSEMKDGGWPVEELEEKIRETKAQKKGGS